MATKKPAPAKGPGPQPFKGPTPKKKSGGEMLQEAFEKSKFDKEPKGSKEGDAKDKAADAKQFPAFKKAQKKGK